MKKLTATIILVMTSIGGCEPGAELPKYGDRAAMVLYAPEPPTSCKQPEDREKNAPLPKRRQLSYHDSCSQLCTSVVNQGESIAGCYYARAIESYGCPNHTNCAREIGEQEAEEIYCQGTRKEEAQRSPLVFDQNQELIVCQMKKVASPR